MDNKQAYLQCCNLVEIVLPPQFVPLQLRILQCLAKNLNESRAREGVKARVVHRILKAFTMQPKDFQPVLYELLVAHLQQSQFAIDVNTIITMVESPYKKISHLGVKILAMVSDPNKI